VGGLELVLRTGSSLRDGRDPGKDERVLDGDSWHLDAP
jgi:hypothetical protein